MRLLLLAFLLIFVVLPIAELTLIFKLGSEIGWPQTLLLVFGAGLAGAAIARVQGIRAAFQVRAQLASGQLPADALVDTVLLALAGLLLILPGIISDVLGIALLFRGARVVVRRGLLSWLKRRFKLTAVRAWPDDDQRPPGGDTIIDARVIDSRTVD